MPQVDSVSLDVVDPFEVWGSELLLRLPGADRDAIRRELGATAQEFLQKSGALKLWVSSTLDHTDPVFDFRQVPTTDPSGEALSEATPWSGLKGLFVHKAVLAGDRYLRLLDRRPLPTSTSAEGVPFCAYVSGTPGLVELVPTPPATMDGTAIEFQITAALIEPVQSVPSVLQQAYRSAILDGAAGRMMSHIKRPYSDARMAEYYLRRFRNEMRVATDEANRLWSNAESSFHFNSDWSRR